MSAWPRLLAASVAACFGAAALTAAAVRPAFAQPARDQAERLNEEGKGFLTAKPMLPTEAADRFQKAIDLVPDGRYYANLCLALYHVGRLGEALTACRAVAQHTSDDRAIKQADNLMEKAIKPRMREAGIDPDAPPPTDTGTGTGTDTGTGTGTDTGTGTGTGTDAGTGTGTGTGTDTGTGTGTGGQQDASNFTVAPPPSLLDQKAAPKHEYTWTLGGQLLGASVAIGYEDAYDSGGAGLRFTGDYLLWPKRGLGMVGFLQFTQIGEKLQSQSLSVADIGVGIYKDLCTGRLCLKPMAGGGFALFQTEAMSENGSDSLVGLSGRAELSAGYAFGARFEHVLTATVGAAAYTKPVGEYELDPEAYGLGESGSAVYLGLGYTHRFNTPFGQSPFFTLQ